MNFRISSNKEAYQQIVQVLPICCVDILVYNPAQKKYLMVWRTSFPAANMWWLPGGRLFKGESFFSCAERKCREELGITIQPVAQLGTYSTYFEKSAWGCPTHTINTVILACITADNNAIYLDGAHKSYRWVDIDTRPEDPYLAAVYDDAIEQLRQH